MSKLISYFKKAAISAAFFLLIFALIIPSAFAVPSSSVQHDFRCEGITLAPAETQPGEGYTVHASFSYYGISRRRVSTNEPELVDCPKCDGEGKTRCSYCSGGGTMIIKGGAIPCKAPGGWPVCQSSCDGYDYACPKMHVQAVIDGNQTWCSCGHGPYSRYGPCTCSTGETEDDKIVPCSRCGGTGYRGKCPECNGNGSYWETEPDTVYPPSNPAPGAVTVEILVDGVVRTSGTYVPTTYQENRNSESWEVWSRLEIEAPMPGEEAGAHTIEARINPSYKSRETDPNNNSGSAVLTVQSPIDLDGEFINPGANYRAGTEVISTFKVYNRDPEGNGVDLVPDDALRVDFQAVNPATGAAIASQTANAVIIPCGGSNIVYFKWRVPDGYSPNTVSLRLHINSDGAVDEINPENNVVTASHPVYSLAAGSTPDTYLEKKAPDSFVRTTTVPTNTAQNRTSVTWEQWVWRDDAFHKLTRTASLSAAASLSLDPHAGYKSSEGGIPVTRSGYALNAVVTAGHTTAPAEAVTNVQRCDALFREFNFQRLNNCFKTLEPITAGPSGARFEFSPNNQSLYGCRAHFTPIWMPDGEYAVSFLVTDYWTPAGMLSGYVQDRVIIDGSMNDDWYTTRG